MGFLSCGECELPSFGEYFCLLNDDLRSVEVESETSTCELVM